MYKLDLPLDYKEAAAIERRRNQESQRKSRIFNAKTRIIGIDKQALDVQVADRKQMELMEKNRDEAFQMDAVRNDQIASLIEKRQDFDRVQLNRATNDFRNLHQQPCGRREFDLYDPESKKKDRPAREGDDDSRCGISSLQKMDGEDLNLKARKKFQNEQNREWYTEQAVEKAQSNQNQKKADRYYDLKATDNDQRALALERAEQECSRAVKTAHSDYNRALAREIDARNSLREQQNLDDNSTELANNIYGDFLTENPGTAQSAFGPNRVVPDRWKGMTPEQLADIRRTQQLQAQENKRIQDDEKRRDEEFARQRCSHARAATLLEREADRRQREIDLQVQRENKRLGVEQTEFQHHLESDVYTNKPTAGYFMQFNSTTR